MLRSCASAVRGSLAGDAKPLPETAWPGFGHAAGPGLALSPAESGEEVTEPVHAIQRLLLSEWAVGLRLTTVPQAMQRLGIADDPRLRWRAAAGLESSWRELFSSPDKRRQIEQALGLRFDASKLDGLRTQVKDWQLASILLTDDEKLVARHVLFRERHGLPLPHPSATATTLSVSKREVHTAIRMLACLGFLVLPDGRRPAHYSLAPDHARLFKGLGCNFHTVTLETGERFGVP